ncbi:MAG TPA: SDR family oxidoreductase [Burkholderiales bacterium]|nr:SDR family oxidoreductase [Burkholderiales bacterium]
MPPPDSTPARVFITGASSGIGEALARQYARHGATLGLLARRADPLERLAASLAVRSYVYPVDVRDAAAMGRAARDFIERTGAPDIVIANAGVSTGNDSAEPADNAVFEEMLAINVTGMLFTFQPFIRVMRQRGSGTLAGIASIAGFRGLPGASAYSASKAAAIAYLESLRVELRRSGVRVVTICPGYIATAMTARNPYRMPFLMPADVAARAMVRAIEHGKRWYVLPWEMAIVGALLRALPRPLYDRLLARAPRKPRRLA